LENQLLEFGRSAKMNNNTSKKNWDLQHVSLLSAFTLLTYWPLTFGIFSAKNDNITQFLPVRFHVSEALNYGHLPLWSPYIYLGYPVHGDMQGGAWNPVVWFLSIFGRYTLTSLHWEIILYLIIAGLGMYRLLNGIGLQKKISLIGSIVYITCGYITDVAGSNIPFLAAAAYIPFVFAYFYSLLASPSFSSAVKCAIFSSLLLVSGYPSFFICTSYILVVGFLTVLLRNFKKEKIKKLLLCHGLLVVVFICLSAPAILSYLHVIPYYSRGKGVSLTDALENSFHPSCSLSFILPTVPIKNPDSMGTDLISRNAYFNIILLAFIPAYFWSKKSLLLNFIMAGIIFFFLFSLGEHTPVRSFCHNVLPLMDVFRHPANARLFVIIGGIVLSLVIFNNLRNRQRSAITTYIQIFSLSLIAAIILTASSSVSKNSIFQSVKILLAGSVTRDKLKFFLDTITLNDITILNAIPQIIFLALFLFFLRKKKPGIILILVATNSFLFAQYSIPYTGVSKIAPDTFNDILKGVPEGYPLPNKNTTLGANAQNNFINYAGIGISHLYDKEIATTDSILTPTFITLMGEAMMHPQVKKDVLTHPYAYLKENVGSFKLEKFTNNEFAFIVEANKETTFVLQQLKMKGWRCFINNKETNIMSINIAFMGVEIPPGKTDIRFEYCPEGIRLTLALFAITVLIIVAVTIKKRTSIV
jgi:hypothetical protein